MREIVTKEICDLCKKETTTLNVNITIFRTFSQEDGQAYPVSRVYKNEKLDLYDECLKKVILIQNTGVQCNEYKFVGGKR